MIRGHDWLKGAIEEGDVEAIDLWEDWDGNQDVVWYNIWSCGST